MLLKIWHGYQSLLWRLCCCSYFVAALATITLAVLPAALLNARYYWWVWALTAWAWVTAAALLDLGRKGWDRQGKGI